MFQKKKVKFIFIFEIQFLVLFLIISFIVIFLFFKNNCVGSIVDSFLPTHAPKIICNFHDAIHVHSKFYGENVPSFLKKFLFLVEQCGYSRFVIVSVFWQVVTNDDDVVNALDLGVLGERDGIVDVFAQGHIVVDNNYVWTNVVAFGVFDRE